MTVTEHAGSKDYISGFWTEKVCVETYGYKYHVHYQGLSEFSDSISEAKKSLRARFKKLCESRIKRWLKVATYGQ
jgi:hypothetical protein